MADEGQDVDRGRWVCAHMDGDEVLHVGCGAGATALMLARMGKTVAGIQQEGFDLAAARHRAAGEDEEVQERVRFVACSPSKLPFKRNAFDTVVLEDLIGIASELEAALAEAARVLRPGGRLLALASWRGAGFDPEEAAASPSSLLEALGPRVAVDHVEDADAWIGLAGRLRARASRASERVVPLEALRVVERRLERSRRAEREQAGLVADSRSELHRVAGEKEAVDDRAFSLAHEVKALHGRERDLQEIVAGRREQIARLEAQREPLVERMRELEARVQAQDEQLARLRRQVDDGGSAHQNTIADRERKAAEAEVLRRELRDKDAALERAAAEAEKLRKELAEGDAALERATAGAETLQRDLMGKDAALKGAAAEAEKLRKDLKDRDAALKRAAAEAGELRKELTGKDAAVQRASEQVEALQQELRDKDQDLRWAQAELGSEQAALAALTARVKGLQSSRSYRLMRRLWRINAAVRRPFTRIRRGPSGDRIEAEGGPDRAVLEPAPAPAAAVEEPMTPSGDEKGSDLGSSDETPAETPVPPGTPASPKPQAPREAPASPAASVETDAERRRWLDKVGPPRSPAELRVAAVLDEMSKACFAPECDLLTFGSDDWREKLEEREPNLLLVESTWQGNSGSWQYQVASYPHPDYAGLPNLKTLLEWCRDRDIPTVFWNKEDPVHFDRFSEAAVLFDHVLTTDSNCIGRYEALEDSRARTIDALPFAAQPMIHNPIALSGERSDSPCFAGAYYRDRHADRRRSLEMLLDAARPHDLVIYDRTYGSEDQAFGFPERFAPHIRGALSYDEMLLAYKTHKLFLNVNSVADSPTMFSRRVFELAACDTAVLSTESAGVANIFGDLIPMVETPDEATETLERLLGDEEERRRHVVPARRLVLGEHTYRKRLAAIAATAGYEVSAEAGEEFAVLMLVDDVEQARGVRPLVSAISEQTTLPAEFLIGVGTRTSVAGDLQQLSDASHELRVRVTQQDSDTSRMERFRELAAIAASPWVAVVHTAHAYGREHFTDLLACTRFTTAEVIGSAAFGLSSGETFNADLEHRFADYLHPHSVLAKRELVAKRGWPDGMPSAWGTLEGWRHEGVRYFSGDRENFRADPALGLPPRRAELSAAAVRTNR
jgi:SAM-dependent methyltransferase